MKSFLVDCKNNSCLYPEDFNEIGQEFDTYTCTALGITDDTIIFFVDGSTNSSESAGDSPSPSGSDGSSNTSGGSDGSSNASGGSDDTNNTSLPEDSDGEDIPLRECYSDICACVHRCDCWEYVGGSKCACEHEWFNDVAVGDNNNNCTSCDRALNAGDVINNCNICHCKTHINDTCIPLDHGDTPVTSDSESESDY